jgi:hypothetical protein
MKEKRISRIATFIFYAGHESGLPRIGGFKDLACHKMAFALMVIGRFWRSRKTDSRSSLVEHPLTGYAIYTKNGDGFYAILGSANGASSMRLLIDHKTELGNQTVEKIVAVRGIPGTRNRVALDLRDDFTRSRPFFLVLSERRTEE